MAMEKSDKSSVLKHLVPGSVVSEHQRKNCKLELQDCGLCAVQEAWKRSRKSWLRLVWEDGRSRFGCSICAKASTETGPWSKFEQDPATVLRKHNLDRHEKSKTHQNAASAEAVGAPPLKEFQDCLRGMVQGQSARQGGGPSDKKTKMRYALSEAVCARNRTLLADAVTVCLMRDERKGKLLVRFRAVSSNLTTVSGVLGLEEVAGSAESIAATTTDLLQKFCQPMLQPPRGSKAQEQAVDQRLVDTIKNNVNIVVNDAAASELLAGDLERGRRSFANRALASFPNMKLVGRDAAHASTRLLKRPFQACEPLQALMVEWIHGSESFAQKVHHSQVLSQWWAKAVQSQEDSDLTRCTSMSAAKHRFSSYFNPLSRIVPNLQCVFDVCGRFEAMRGAEAAWATRLCRNFSAFKAVLLAMVADAVAISNDYTRDCDREDTDVAQLNARANHFVLSARSLFVERKVLTLPTFTKRFLDRKRAVTIVQDGGAREIIVKPSDLDRAFQVMEEIVDLFICP